MSGQLHKVGIGQACLRFLSSSPLHGMCIIDYAVEMTLLVGVGPENEHNPYGDNEHDLFWSWGINENSPYTHSLYQKNM